MRRTLVGGQMVLLHALEHGQVPPQVSQDGDVLTDIRAMPTALKDVVAALNGFGFALDGTGPDAIAHRYTRPSGPSELPIRTVTVDVLAPDGVGPSRRRQGDAPGCRCCDEPVIEGGDGGRPMDDCGVEHDHVRKPQTGVRTQPGPADGSIVVHATDVVRAAQRSGGVVERAEPRRRDEALGERHRMQEDVVVRGGVVDGGGGGVVGVCRVSQRNDPAGVGDDHAGQSPARS